MANDYKSLSDAYAVMRKNDDQWAKSIKEQAYKLRDSLFAKYAPVKSHWNDEEGKRREPYVYLFSLVTGPKTPKNPLPDECIQAGYKLVFGLALVVENVAYDERRHFHCIATVAQYQANCCMFKRLSSDGEEIPGEIWYSSAEAYADYVLQSVSERMRFDPFSGGKPPSSMGFF